MGTIFVTPCLDFLLKISFQRQVENFYTIGHPVSVYGVDEDDV